MEIDRIDSDRCGDRDRMDRGMGVEIEIMALIDPL